MKGSCRENCLFVRSQESVALSNRSCEASGGKGESRSLSEPDSASLHKREWSNLHLLAFIRTSLGLVFFSSGLLKSLNVFHFGVTIAAFGMFPATLIPVIAVLLPLLEILLGASLLFDIHSFLSSIVSSALLLSFSAVITLVLLKGLTVNCGCFGVFDDTLVSPAALLRNGILLFLFLVIVEFSPKRTPPYSMIGRTRVILFLGMILLALGYSYSEGYGNDLVSVVLHFPNYYSLSVGSNRVSPEYLLGHSPVDVKMASPNCVADLSKMRVVQSSSDLQRIEEARYKLFMVFSLHDCFKCLRELGYWNQFAKGHVDDPSIAVFAIAIATDVNRVRNYFLSNHLGLPLFCDTTHTHYNAGSEAITPIKILTQKNWKVVKATMIYNSIEEISHFRNVVDSCINRGRK